MLFTHRPLLLVTIFVSLVLHIAALYPFTSSDPLNEKRVLIEIESSSAPRNSKTSETVKKVKKSRSSPSSAHGISEKTVHDLILGSDIGIQAIYPRLSRSLGESGEVHISIDRLLPQPHITVSQSSGFARLDNAALEATRRALEENLLSHLRTDRSHLRIKFVFRLVLSKE